MCQYNITHNEQHLNKLTWMDKLNKHTVRSIIAISYISQNNHQLHFAWKEKKKQFIPKRNSRHSDENTDHGHSHHALWWYEHISFLADSTVESITEAATAFQEITSTIKHFKTTNYYNTIV